jgi:hypothetical protein
LQVIPLSSITNLRSLSFRLIIADDKTQIIWLLNNLSELRGAYHGLITVNFIFINPGAVSDVRDELNLVDELLADLKRNAGADIEITIPFEVSYPSIESLFPQATKMHLMYFFVFFLSLYLLTYPQLSRKRIGSSTWLHHYVSRPVFIL